MPEIVELKVSGVPVARVAKMRVELYLSRTTWAGERLGVHGAVAAGHDRCVVDNPMLSVSTAGLSASTEQWGATLVTVRSPRPHPGSCSKAMASADPAVLE